LGSLKAFYKKKDMTGSNHLGIPLNLFHKRKKVWDLAITCVRGFQGDMSFLSFEGKYGGALADEHAKKRFFEANPKAYHPRWGWKGGGFRSFKDIKISEALERGEAGGQLRADYLQSMHEALYAAWEEADAERDAVQAVAAVTAGVQADQHHGWEVDDAAEDLPALDLEEAFKVLRPHLKEEFKDTLFDRGNVLCAWSTVGCSNLRRRMGDAAWDPIARTFELPHNPGEQRGPQQGKAKCKGTQKGFQGLLAHAKTCAAEEMTEEEEEDYWETNGAEPDQDSARLHRLLVEVLESIAVNPVTGL
jgi:hypothetical protein